MAKSRRKELFPNVTDQQWNDWKWQVRNRIESLEQLKKYVKLSKEEEEGIRKSLKTIRMAITPSLKGVGTIHDGEVWREVRLHSLCLEIGIDHLLEARQG